MGRDIFNLKAPLNLSHRLNRGRVMWLKCMPGLLGGLRWLDLCIRNHAILTNFTTSASGFRPTTRRGGYGEMRFDGTDDVAEVNHGPQFILDDLTMAAWVKTTQSGQGRIIDKFSQLNDQNSMGLLIVPAPYFFCDNPGASDACTGGTVNDGAWHRLVATRESNVAMRLYVDGVEVANKTSSFTTGTIDNANHLWVGQDTFSGGNFYSGALDDVMVYNRFLTADEVWEDWILSLQGYPGVLNRYPAAVSIMPVASTANRIRQIITRAA